MRETGRGFSPELEQPAAEVLPEKRNRTLNKIKEMARTLVMVGMTSGLAAGTVSAQGIEKDQGFDFVKWYGKQYERIYKLESKDAKLRELYGDNYFTSAAFHKESVERGAKRFVNTETASRQYFRPVDSFEIRVYPGETKDTEKALTQTVEFKDGDLSAKILSEILETYPKGWVNNEIESVTQEEQAVENEDSGSREGWVTVAGARVSRAGKKKLVFYKVPMSEKPAEYVVETLGHEIAHGNDWFSDNEMNDEERADLALAISERLSAEDRFQSSYVESIEHEDKKKERYKKATEYWAEISAQYFENASKLNVKDFIIVDQQVQKTHPGFNWRETKERRDNLIRQSLKQHDTKYAPGR